MPELHVLREGLTEYSYYILETIQSILIEEIPDDVKDTMLANLHFKFANINLIITDVNYKMENNITSIRISNLKKYYKDHNFSINDIETIKQILRRINNRYYALTYRRNKKNNDH